MKTELKTSLRNREYIKRALTKMGFSFTEAKEGESLTTKGHYGVREKVDILVHTNNDAVGFRQNEDGTFTAIGDFYGVKSQDGTRLDTNSFGIHTQVYSSEAEMTDKLVNMGFMDNGNRVDNKDYVELTFERAY